MKYREKLLAKRVAAVLVLSTVSIFCFKAVRSGPRAHNTPPQRVLESKPSKPLKARPDNPTTVAEPEQGVEPEPTGRVVVSKYFAKDGQQSDAVIDSFRYTASA